MHLLCGLRGDETLERLPELRRRFCAAPDKANAAMATGRVHEQPGAVGQAGASEVQPGGRRGALREGQGCRAGEAVSCLLAVIASEAKQSRLSPRKQSELPRRKGSSQ